MNENALEQYEKISRGAPAFYAQRRALIAVWGKESVQFLNGMVTNDVAKLEDGAEMLAAFPNAQGRLLALVRVHRRGEQFLFETEAATGEKVFQNLYRFTFAGDFFVEDLSERHRSFLVKNFEPKSSNAESIEFENPFGRLVFAPADSAENFIAGLRGAVAIPDELFETLRVEAGLPVYGADMDETTIVPELGLDGLVSYNKGCYIGQEIIARIHFRGHVAKQLRGLAFAEKIENGADDLKNAELKTPDGKNAGRLTSIAFSPALGRTVALGYVRYDHLAEGTELRAGDRAVTVKNLPFIE